MSHKFKTTCFTLCWYPLCNRSASNSLKHGHKPTLGVACGVRHHDVCSRSFRCCISGGDVPHVPTLLILPGFSSPCFLPRVTIVRYFSVFLTPVPHAVISGVTHRVVCRALFFLASKRWTEKRGGELNSRCPGGNNSCLGVSLSRRGHITSVFTEGGLTTRVGS